MITRVKGSVAAELVGQNLTTGDVTLTGNLWLKYTKGISFSEYAQTVANSITFSELFNNATLNVENSGTGVPDSIATVYDATTGAKDIDAVGIIKVQGQDAALYAGAGSPEAIVTAPPGSIYLNISGGVSTTLYVKQSGISNTGWVGK